ncbi:LLM class F420-dependent oxidoreductase [Mycolicibacterium litorale]|uniref:LLM class F420-dependent oxidoreductase n=1 Tax=Mycolicibacterium litorale TaxID=758802 RepID=UPI003CEBC4E2
MAAKRTMRIAAQVLPGGARSYAQWRSAVVQAEQLGADIIFGYDHLLFPDSQACDQNGRPSIVFEERMSANFEGWTALSSWAEITTRAEIGLLVTNVGFRNADLLADMARTVDHISGGRLILGLGSGWYEPEYDEYGFPFSSAATRVAVLATALERIRARFAGLVPPPVRDIPILIGGAGEKQTLPLVARYADIWHAAIGPEAFERKNDILVQHAEAVGRDPSAIERAVSWTGLEDAERFTAAGVTLFNVVIQARSGYDMSPLKEAVEWRDWILRPGAYLPTS